MAEKQEIVLGSDIDAKRITVFELDAGELANSRRASGTWCGRVDLNLVRQAPPRGESRRRDRLLPAAAHGSNEQPVERDFV